MSTRELLLHAWTWRPGVVGALITAFAAHVVGMGFTRPGRTLALLGACAAVILALLSPIDALAQGTLFSAHMLQHMLLALVAPPLALLAIPPFEGAVAPGSDDAPRRSAAIGSWAAGVGAMWVWHMPTLCNAAAASDVVRAVQNVSLPLMGAAFWWPIVGPRLDQRLPEPAAAGYLFFACVACSVLGISIAFSPVAVCAAYGHGADAMGASPLVRGRWGLTPAVDQQLGGLLMWVPGCTAYAAAILAIVARFYGVPHGRGARVAGVANVADAEGSS
jgi:putative membrane protein